jgi:hypothetical protein
MGDNLIDVKSLIVKPFVKEEGLVDVSSLIKKKEPTASSSLNGQFQLPLSKPLEEGEGLSENSFLEKVGKNASATVTPMGITELPIKEIKETEISLKPKKEAKQYYNTPLEKGIVFTDKTKILEPSSRALSAKIEKAPEMDLKKSTQKDYIEKIRQEPIEEQEPEKERSWANIGQNFADNMWITVSDLLESGALKLRESGTSEDWTSEEQPKLFEKGKKTEYAKSADWINDPFGKIALGLNGVKQVGQADLQYNRLPDTMIGNLTESVLGMAPDVLLSEAIPTSAISKTASTAEKFGKLIFNNFTKYLGVKKASSEYNKAIEEGKSNLDANLEALKGGSIGTGEGILYALGGAGSNYMTKSAMSQLTKAGLTGAKGLATKEAINVITDGIMYGGAVPLVQSGVQGKLPTGAEMTQGVGLSLLFSAKRSLETATTNAELNKALDDVKAIKQTVALQNFIDATPESIDAVHKSNESANDLNVKALEAAKKAREATDLDKKQQYVGEAMTYTKAANVKQMTEVVLNNQNIDKVVAESDLPDNLKQQFLEKSNLIYKQLHPDEMTKRDIGEQIKISEDEIRQLQEITKTSQDPVEIAEANNKINKLKADVESGYSELDNIINKQNLEKEKANKIIVQTERTGGIEPELPEGGVTIATETGLTNEERNAKIEERKKETNLSAEILKRNELVQNVKEYFGKGKRERNSSEGLRKLNELRSRAREIGLEVDDKSESLIKKTGARKTKIKYNSKAEGDAIIEESGKTLYDRNKDVQDIFNELHNANGYLDVKREDGVRMSEAQMDATIQDILDGIPSKRANRYLDELEKSIQDDAFVVYDKSLGEKVLSINDIRDLLGVEAETAGQPMDEESFVKFLDEESKMTPEEEKELTDNIENLLYEYEPETGVENEVQQVNANPEKGISTETEQASVVKEATKGAAKLEIEAKSLKDIYNSLPKGEKLRKEAVKSNIDEIISKLVTENKIKKEC